MARSARTPMTARAATLLAVLVALVTPQVASAEADTDRYLVAGTDQASQKVLVLDPAKTDWASAVDSKALKWSWSPTSRNGFSDTTPGWRNVDEAKLRYSELYDTRFMLTTASGGFVGLIHYPSGKRKWSVNADDGIAPLDNPHSAELLPDGNVAAAASSGGWLRIYTASQGPDAEEYVEYPLPGGHGVLWDPERELLWALGDHHLVALEVGGTSAQPTLNEVHKTELPSFGGHDLQPVYGDTDRLWVTTNSAVYQYSKSRDAFTTDYPMADRVNRSAVKAVSNHPITGQVIETKPKLGCATTWCTDTVDFFGPDMTRTRPGAQFYKARWFVAAYQ